ncbi:hypothetical protein BDV29DRAFT_175534 [Aspergillus leporis]|jgi:hypothetical protein|uniref:Uncharacterized protein n=1 Tax=Aspergillus leporis TaxID=41062 RepID=A0A5N5X1Y7_9EURO|nr:hypothetical protein BDV29DRAFT_175534 [Aspergillus leporis]
MLDLHDNEGNARDKYLPHSWAPKPTGVNMRVRFYEANISPKLVIEFTLFDSGNRVHRAFLIFGAYDHVIAYDSLDRSFPSKQQKKKKKSSLRAILRLPLRSQAKLA